MKNYKVAVSYDMSDSISTHRKYVNILHTDFSYIAAIIISLDNIQDGRLDFIEQNSFGQPVFAIINKDEVIPTNIINRLTGVIDLNKKNTDRIQPAVPRLTGNI
ncbi:TPA: Orn/Lys/Arg decarboxylase N-terminal domain-containing protein [Proteus mirabilis]|nr:MULTISPECIES: Orn/Lys/Arg decarboxylase N-terminal domain-containing protein [Enterobacterales]MCY0816604.1 amino acid decarboxylase [Escherichia coli]STV27498.1 ornithine decarboxylase [Klebsiella pneumoniae]KKC57768.1 amino acid decarboxylase [Proteus mirabilis]MBG2846602.1 amino acid decarboxylase [Proteus mirabilis]MBG2872439.1 amino acid decarboxylase [Proteus mirabilis]